MNYLMTNVKIFKGTNSRGDYHWMSAQLFNDVNVKANPTRLPYYYITLDLIVEAFLACKDALTQNANGWLDVDLSKVPDEGLTKHHVYDVNAETVILDGWYQQCYSRDYTDANGVTHTKGSVRLGRNGLPLPPVNSLKVQVSYYEAETFENGMKVTRWIPVETKEEIARGILERSYRKVRPEATAIAEEPEPEPEEEDVEAKRKALEEQLKALG